ncbi:AMP-binding protein [Alcaligenaceae bacterium]|nr:AMP-binding protein [Alcaligenaceae bacterium]
MSLFLSMPELLAHQVGKHPDDVAFIDGEREITYAEFGAMCRKTAVWLAAQGIGPGDRVAVWLVNRIEWLTLYFGLSHIGATLVAVNTRYRSNELEYILERSQAKLLVLELNFRKIDFPAVLADVNPASAQSLERVAILNATPGNLQHSILGKPTVAFSLTELADGDVPLTGGPDSLSLLFTTSGTTSGPKLVMHLQRTVTLHSQRVAKSYGFEEDGSCLLAALPFCGVFGFNAAFAAFAAGKPAVIMDTFDGAEAARLITHHHATHVFGSDEMFQRILDHTTADIPFPSARVFGFAFFHPGVEEFAGDAWKRQVPLFGLYGSSEVQALFSLQRVNQPVLERIKGGGLPAHAGAEIRIRDIDTGEILPVGHSGAIEIRSDSNFVGYLNNQEATQKAIDKEGFFSTGDVGYLREDGSFVYQTRQGDAMRLAGYLVSPVEIEDILKEQPGVANAQVVGVELNGQARCAAFVILEPGHAFDEASLKAGVAGALAAFKVPVSIWSIPEFPTTQSSNGAKIQRAKLRDMAMQRIQEIK